MTVDLQQVKSFWEKNPLWLGESKYKPGSLEFFEEHRKIYIDDCFAGNFDIRFLPFIVGEVFFHFFPARTLPFRIPQKLHRWLDSHAGFMIYAQVRKKSCVE